MKRKREIRVQNEEVDKILIEFLVVRYTYHDRSKWEEYIDNERVLINNSRALINQKLKKNDLITYIPEPIVEPPINRDYQTIYEDDDLLVINKPCDIPCHPGGIYFENTLWYILKEKYNYISLINRLDRETSGVMLIAKNRESAKFYFNKMMERQIEKEYLVLVHGDFPETLSGRGWLRPDIGSVIRKKRLFIPDIEAQQPKGEADVNRQFSHSEFSLVKKSGGLSIVKCKIITGRTHQIRATISSLGFPVVGDKIYGLDDSYFFKFINDELTKNDWESLVLKNQALHSYKTVAPMINGKNREFIATEPNSWPMHI